ncbi:ribonuclease H-like domain-containing protein [Halalkalibacter nanhaiisediminis]|uniref:YprB ribonuclease H-like domain-containing protein n=1 Tax=Halalkalibacter nanhaiisediminis TaxID=688079 RepID=A0A562QQH8_9BACI|nr:ribonuclease H-like domain-containing protein [Halalkalibacter nanhaiisediminis]TWI58967.1 hypothetical protein IQ10_00676 [Halalkalibacter nanhaiisediminis]
MMKQKLLRMKQHMGIEKEQQSTLSPPPVEEIKTNSKTIPFEEEWRAYDTNPLWFEEDYTLMREKEYSLDHKHGRYLFSELCEVVKRWQDHIYEHPLSAKGRRAEDLLFFDTETTGLSSGVGNTIFMLGYCQIQEEQVRVKQYFLPGPEAEVALYHHFLTDVGNTGNLVTFNGKAFDWPQVKTRHTFVRDQVPKLPKFGHFDLLHASRRFWKNTLPSCKLSIVEQEILQFERIEDTPSYMAPMLYFDFLQEQDPDFVKGIFQHHEWDVLSLMTLYTHLSSLLLNSVHSTQYLQRREAFEIARWYEAMGEKELSQGLYEQLLREDDEVAHLSQFAFAKAKKQSGDWRLALFLFEELVGKNHFIFEAAIECAKIYEHQYKDIEKALYFTEVARANTSSLAPHKNEKKQQIALELQQRKLRLEKKYNKK